MRLQHRRRHAGPGKLPAQQSGQEAAQPVDFQRHRRQVEIAKELRHLTALLGCLVLLVAEDRRQIAQPVQPVAALPVGEQGRHHAAVPRLALRRHPLPGMDAIGRVPPAGRRHHPPAAQHQHRHAARLAVFQLRLVGAQAIGVEPAVGDADRPQHHLAVELVRPGRPLDPLDRLSREAGIPGALALVIADRQDQPLGTRPERERSRRSPGAPRRHRWCSRCAASRHKAACRRAR